MIFVSLSNGLKDSILSRGLGQPGHVRPRIGLASSQALDPVCVYVWGPGLYHSLRWFGGEACPCSLGASPCVPCLPVPTLLCVWDQSGRLLNWLFARSQHCPCHTQCLSTVLRWYLRVIGCGHSETPAESLNQVHLLCPCAVLRHSAWMRMCPGGPAPDGDVSSGWPSGDLRHWGHGSREDSSDVSSSRGHFNSIGSSVLSEGGALGHMMPEWGPAGVPTSGGKRQSSPE